MNPYFRYIIRFTIFVLVYYIAGLSSLLLAGNYGNITPIWFPSGFALGLLMVLDWRFLPAIFFGTIILTIGIFPFWGQVLISFGNCLEATFGYFLILHFFQRDKIFHTLKGTLSFLFFCAILGPIFSASIGSFVLYFTNIQTHSGIIKLFFRWWSGDLIGILIITPYFLLINKDLFLRIQKKLFRSFEFLLIFSAISVLSYFIFSGKFQFPYFFLPPLVFAIYRFGFYGLPIFSSIIFTFAVYFIDVIPPPLRSEDGYSGTILKIQLFCTVLTGTGFVFASVLNERAEAFLEMKKNWEMYKSLADNFPGVVLVLDKDLVCKIAAGVGVIGDPNFYLGKKANEFIPEENMRGVNAFFEKAFNGVKSFYNTIYKERHYTSISSPLYDKNGKINEILITSQNISELKNAENALRESENKYKQIFQKNSAIKWIVDPNTGGFVEVNEAAVDFYGYSKEEFQILKIWDINLLSKEQIIKRLNESMRHQQFYQFQHKLKSGSVRFVEDYTGPVIIQGKTYIHSILQDITERKHFEEELLKLNQTLENKVFDRTSELVSANQELESFSYSISHDLRAPIRAISGFTQILKEDYQNEIDIEGQKILDRIIKATERMNNMIGALLDLSKIIRTSALKKEINLTDIARSIISEIQSENKNLIIRFHAQENLIVVADIHLIRILLQNLLENSVKYSSKNEFVEIDFGETEINGLKCFYVKDQGIGFDMAYFNKLFKVFQRLHSNSEFEGIGIGLATVDRIIKRHNGKIWAMSSPGNGATFYFTLS